jgi:hypothetical protein
LGQESLQSSEQVPTVLQLLHWDCDSGFFVGEKNNEW